MTTVNIHEAKTHLSRLIERVLAGEQVTIAKAGKPVVKVVPVDAPEPKAMKRIGAMAGMFAVPDDFDTFMQDEIIAMFEESEIFPPERDPGAGDGDDAGRDR